MLAIPKSILEGLGLAANEKVSLRLDDGRLVIEARPRPRYTLAELLAECDPTAPAEAEAIAFDANDAVGREEI
jgi:antitoxin ChpS